MRRRTLKSILNSVSHQCGAVNTLSPTASAELLIKVSAALQLYFSE